MSNIRRLTLSTVIALATVFSEFASAAPQELPLAILSTGDLPDGKNIGSYTAAVDAILRVIVEKLGLSAPRGKLLIYATREEFERGLVDHLKVAPNLARDTARFAKSAVGGCNVLVNQPAIADTNWPQRIELLAHELAHGLQLTLARRCGLARPQWMIEATAEWLAFRVTSALNLDDMSDVRARLAEKVRALGREGRPRITELDSLDEWVRARSRYGFDATYSQSFLVADFLVERHSLERVTDYFARFAHSDDHHAHFAAAFGESVEAFERALEAHLSELLN